MRVVITTLLATAAMTSTAFAAGGAPAHKSGILCWAFIVFCIAVLGGQTIPVALRLLAANGLTIPPRGGKNARNDTGR